MTVILVAFGVALFGTPRGFSVHASGAALTWQDDGFVADSLNGGIGTAQDPYRIATPQQLARIARITNGGGLNIILNQIDWSTQDNFEGRHFLLTADIDLRGRDWVAIGGGHLWTQFAGTFDGGGHEIILPQTLRQEVMSTFTPWPQSHATIAFGFFGATRGATIRNLRIRGDVIEWTSSNLALFNVAQRFVGGVVGFAPGTDFKSVEIVGHLSNIVSPQSSIAVGGIAGYLVEAEVKNVMSNTRINVISAERAFVNVGGIFGMAGNSLLVNVVNRGNISEIIVGTVLSAGGIVGLTTDRPNPAGQDFGTEFSLNLYNVVNYGDIFATMTARWVNENLVLPDGAAAGGLVGSFQGNHRGNRTSSIINAYNRGNITVQGQARFDIDVGGIVGGKGLANLFGPSLIENAYNAGALQGQTVGQIAGSAWAVAAEFVNVWGLTDEFVGRTINFVGQDFALEVYSGGIIDYGLEDNLNARREDFDSVTYSKTTAWISHENELPQLVDLTFEPYVPGDVFFTVTFLDMHGGELEVQTLLEGIIITPIEAPSIQLFLFLYWRTIEGDDLFTPITQDTIFLAIYQESEVHWFVTITFLTREGEVIMEVIALMGFIPQELIPEPPPLAYHEFFRWFNLQGLRTESQVMRDTSFMPIYRVIGDGPPVNQAAQTRQAEPWQILLAVALLLVKLSIISSLLTKKTNKRRRR